ncbi:MAG TPA: rhodanese-related sulfurtransferase [Catalimonadaceae bacterium]|nr:rhodanese-related sulfurtransferase [Catalimonadaceae bacterium]HPI10966.1 rhodanese-related sulfurtransferase [Catalimonadaceae bacterium]
MKLHNAVNKKELKQKLEKNPVPRKTVSFYKYHPLPNPQIFRDHLYLLLEPVGVLGRIYVASEGINAQISVPLENWDLFISKTNEITFLEGNRLNLAVEDNPVSFVVLKVKLRNKIVADGLDDNTFNPSATGIHLKAKEFNELAARPDTVLVDMRNHYESEVGHFEGAILPDVDTFRDSLPIVEEILKPHEDKHIIMYCTGGIRCEKASAWFKHRGFKNVYQLEGGIIKYANDVKEQGLENRFHGKNFVFDERLGERISEEIISHCHQCGGLADTHTNCKNEACHLLFIQCSHCAEKFNGCCCEECQRIYHLPEEEQKQLRAGARPPRNVFRKGRIEEKIRPVTK